MIDWTRVEELIAEIGAEDFGEVVELFLEEVDAAMEALDNILDPTTGSRTLHLVKGCAWNLGFAALGKRCAILETNGVQINPQVAQDLRTVYATSRTALKEGLNARNIIVDAA
ncbi:MAG: Hpt domain-containing protein [Dinoroseobacter sp.]|nr:Hpt domain-containing protein [Dinoroseobacter sp.]MDJ0995181.1 Hpt domain-containing protein [Dinoroseobacter sp.]